MNSRVARLREKIAKENLDALVVTVPENQLYLSGFNPGHSYLDATMILSKDHAWISTDSRYYEDVKAKDFSQKLKAQITDSKKHKVQGLILFFAANMTDGSVEKKISNILSEISQIDDTFIKPISPERVLTYLHTDVL